tara:strand:+ start:1019 stop:1195 length:177 start_codon:yes stop_codon:yes gene_type:complete
MQTENKIALETIIPDKMNDSIKANKKIAIQANSLLLLRKDSIFSNIYIKKLFYFNVFT